MYRGTAHDGITISQARMAQDMIYRGVRHDGLAPAASRIAHRIAMTYRAVQYFIVSKETQADRECSVKVATPALPFGAHLAA